MKFEKTMKIFEQYCHNTRKTINRSKKVIPEKILREIEKEGVTCERLENMNIPIFMYKTQITLHGSFPELYYSNMATGYKSIFQNQNKSIGIKYIAIDIGKKKRINNVINEYYNYNREKTWSFVKNSQECFFQKIKRVKSWDDYKEDYKEIKDEISGIVSETKTERTMSNGDTIFSSFKSSLFIGGISILLGMDIYQRVWLLSEIHINSIPEKNMNMFFEKFFKDDINNIKKTCQNNRIAKIEKEKEEKILSMKKDKEYKNNISRIKEDFLSFMENKGFVYKKKMPIKEGLVYVQHMIDYKGTKLTITSNKLVKSNYGSKLDQFVNTSYEKEIITDDKFYDFTNSSKDFTQKSTRGKYAYVNGWVKPEWDNNVKTHNAKPTKQKTTSGKLKMIEYSNLSIAVIGDTKSHKDKLKELGGRFNFRLSCGPGWIFSNKLKEKLENFINDINK